MIGLVLAAAVAVAPLRPGVWSSIRMDRASGDWAGMKLALAVSSSRIATVTVCGDGCSGAVATPIVRDASGFSFALPVRGDADPAKPAERCHARFVRNMLYVACSAPGLEAPLHRIASGPMPSRLTQMLEKSERRH